MLSDSEKNSIRFFNLIQFNGLLLMNSNAGSTVLSDTVPDASRHDSGET